MNKSPLAGGVALALLIVGYGCVQFVRNAASPPKIVVTPAQSQDARVYAALPAMSAANPATSKVSASVPSATTAARPAKPPAEEEGPVVVHVVGAVREPGVYHLRAKARLAEALHAAGGAKNGADLEAVNLASFVQDGEQIRVPTLAERRAGEAARVAAARSGGITTPVRPTVSKEKYPVAAARARALAGAAAARTSAASSNGPVNINTAGAEELDSLPGVGPKTAEAILEFRREHGPFQRVEDLLEIRGIGEKKLARMRDRVLVR